MMNSPSQAVSLRPQIPELLTRSWEDWQVIFPADFKAVVLVEDLWQAELEKEFALARDFKGEDFRQQLIVGNTPLLMGVFRERKEFRFYSARLNQELFLLEHLSLEQDADDCAKEDFLNFKEHANCIAKLNADHFPSSYELMTHRYQLDSLGEQRYRDLIGAENKLATKLRAYMKEHQLGPFEKMSDFALGLTAEYKLLRVHMLKFLAILPNLDHDREGREVKRILVESMRRLVEDSANARRMKIEGEEQALPQWMEFCFSMIRFLANLLAAKPLAFLVRQSVKVMAKRFIAGEQIDQVQQSFDALFKTGRDITLDQLGELVVSEQEADHYCAEVLKLVRGLGQYIPKGEKNGAGINRAHVSIKVSALCRDMKPEAFDYSYGLVAPRLKKILLEAKAHDVFINIDAEHYHYRDIVLNIYRRVLLETQELHDYSQTGIVLQAYLRDGAKHLDDIIALAKERGHRMPIRLVKGAYWDAETVEAMAHSFDAPEFLNKEETDLHFRQLILKIFKNSDDVQLCIASHNFADHCFSEVARSELYPNHPVIEHQCLHMTYEALSTAMAKMNWPVRNYVPIGGLLVGMGYLVRRIMENSSQVGVLTIMRSHNKKQEFKNALDIHLEKKKKGLLTRDPSVGALTSEFFNITPVRPYLETERLVIEKSYTQFKAQSLGHHYPGSFVLNGEQTRIFSSSDPDLLVGEIRFATLDDAEEALSLSEAAFNDGPWSQTPWLNRASTLLKAANLMLAQRNDLAALISYEAGKAINEAYGDVDEAIDFLNFYAREEANFDFTSDQLIPCGPVAAITPWNFPLAIPTGMVAAPLVAGNTVILKSAEQTPLSAQKLFDLLHTAGVPQNVLIHLPGPGETIGDALVRSEKIATIVFTGSKAVGMMIGDIASQRLYRGEFPVKVITEMGGKNAIIVTANAELDETVAGVLASAFGHAGQKCSAASRLLVDQTIKERLVTRLEKACRDLEVGKAFSFSTIINPVITKEDQERLKNQIAEACDEAIKYQGRVISDRSKEDLPGFCVGPAIIELPANRTKVESSYATKELFGPVLHIIPFKDLDEALEIYNGTKYGLTGGIFGQSQDDIDYCVSKMYSGNLYINRNITGARVGVEPFGGFKHSGTGPKAGSRDYLQAFRRLRPALEAADYGEFGTLRDDIKLAVRNVLPIYKRVQRLSICLKKLHENFEALYGGIRAKDKKSLAKFLLWVERDLEDFILKRDPNHFVPGQISYNDYQLTHFHLTMVSFCARPQWSILLNILSAMAMGMGVTVMVANEDAKKWWQSFLQILMKGGWPIKSFNVLSIAHDEKELSRIFKNFELGQLLVDGPIEMIQKIKLMAQLNAEDKEYITTVRSHLDSPLPHDFKSSCKQYILVRAFAVNTMRHGAPLEIGL